MQDFLSFDTIYSCARNASSREYRDKKKKEAPYAKLLEKLKEVDGKATKAGVIKRINNIRNAFLKEKKFEDSIK